MSNATPIPPLIVMVFCHVFMLPKNESMLNVMLVLPLLMLHFLCVFVLPKNENASNVHRVKLDSNWEVQILSFLFCHLIDASMAKKSS
jgi:hypothetical protein